MHVWAAEKLLPSSLYAKPEQRKLRSNHFGRNRKKRLMQNDAECQTSCFAETCSINDPASLEVMDSTLIRSRSRSSRFHSFSISGQGRIQICVYVEKHIRMLHFTDSLLTCIEIYITYISFIIFKSYIYNIYIIYLLYTMINQ